MPRVVHFEIPADNPERAAAFYGKAFGWTIQKWDGPMDYWMVITGDADQPGINGGLFRRSEGSQTTVNTIDVESVDAAVEKIVAAGGTIARPKMAVPGVGYLAYCHDPEGNFFGIIEPEPPSA